MTSHTPGPWDIRSDAITGHGRERVVVESPDAQFQLADCGFASSKVAVANASLIAAAPELLVALKALLAFDEVRYVNDEGPADEGWQSATLTKAFSDAEAAIQKAECHE